jgi:hypothetical protein
MKHFSLLFALLFFFINGIFSQKSIVAGKVIDENQQPLSFMSVYIVQFTDTLKVEKSTISDLQGNFVLDKVSAGKYVLVISSIGFKTVKDTIDCPLLDTVPKSYILYPSVEQLSEVIVSAKLTQRFADKNVYILPALTRKNASNAFDAIKILPKLTVDLVNRKITTVHGDNVQILINGINSDEAELLTLNPSDIVKIEHYEMPSARFATNNVGSVINIVTKQAIQGGAMYANLQNAVLTGFGNDQVSVKYNKDNNQYMFGYSVNYRSYKKRTVNNSYNYFENSNKVDKTKIGLNSPFDYKDHNFGFGFINQLENNYIFSSKLTFNIYSGHTNVMQDIFINNKNIGNYCNSHDEDFSLRPSLDLYYSKKIKSNQELTLNVVSTYFNIDYTNNYLELIHKDTSFINSSLIKGVKYSSIIEGIYSIKKDKYKLNFGANYSFANSENKFSGTDSNDKISAFYNNSYSYIEIVGGFDNLSYQLSTGLIYNVFQSKQLEKKYNFLTFRPSLEISYNLTQASQVKLTGTIEPYTPTLSELSSNLIFEDSIMVYTGNPALKPYSIYKSSLAYSYNLSKFNFTTSVNGFYANSIILSEYDKRGSYFIQTQANQKWQKQISVDFDIQISPFEKKWVELELYGELYNIKNKGSHFSNERVDFLYQTTLSFNYNYFALMGFFQNGYNTLIGEMLQRNASTSFLQFQYKKDNLTLASGLYYPLEKSWHTTYESYNSPIIQTKYRTDIFDNGSMFYINLIYNFSFGRRFNTEAKKISNQDDDSGILKQSKQ